MKHASLAFFIGLAFLSTLGDGIVLFSLTLAAADELGSWGVSGLFLAGLLPPVLAARPIGRLVDRSRLLRTWVITLGAHVVLFALMYAVGSVLFSLALMAIVSICSTINGAIIFKILPALLGGASVNRASSFLVAATSLSGIIAPVIAASGYGAWGVESMLLASAAAYALLCAGALLGLRPQPRSPQKDAENSGSEGQLTSREMLRDPVLRALVLPVAAIILFTACEGVAGVFYLREVAPNDTVYSVMLAAWSVGALLGSLLGGSAFFQQRMVLPVLGGAVLVGTAILIEGVWAQAAAITAVFLLGGLGNGLHNTGIRTAIYLRLPESTHGTAWAYLRMLINIMVGLGYLLGTPGLLIDSARWIVIISGAGTLLVCICCAMMIPRRRSDMIEKVDHL